MLRKVFLVTILLLFVCTFLQAAEPPRASGKPMPPVGITIHPVSPEITPDTVKPGDVVEFVINAVSGIDVPDMHITVKLEGGARLVSGEANWTGQAKKGEAKTLMIAVAAPETGQGKVRAVVSLPASQGPYFSAEAQFVLGPGGSPRHRQEPVLRKSKKGKSIIEYH